MPVTNGNGPETSQQTSTISRRIPELRKAEAERWRNLGTQAKFKPEESLLQRALIRLHSFLG